MEELKAPEKIHVQPNAHDRWFEGKIPNGLPNGLFVEYTRTDAFVEKAMKFLYDYNRNMVKKHGARAVLGCCEFTINVDDFRKYMEGE